MLPSSGYFKSVLCPFYNNGLCERPHCHYKHAKRDAAGQASRRSSVEEAAVGLCSNDGNRAELLAMVNMAIKKVQEDINRAKELTNLNEYSPAQNSSPTYIPTPVARCPSSQHGIADLETPKPSVVPEYKPTPIAQLRKLKKHHALNLEDNNDAAYKSVVTAPSTKKRKRVEEYDPTEVKCVHKNLNVENICDTKKIKFNDNKINLNHTLNTLSYQPHDLELDNEVSEHDNDITPCFSDDSDSEINLEHYSKNINDKENVTKESKSVLNKHDKENVIIQTNPLNIVDRILDESRRTDEKIKIIKKDAIQKQKEETSHKKEIQPQKEHQEEIKWQKEPSNQNNEKGYQNNEKSQQNNEKNQPNKEKNVINKEKNHRKEKDQNTKEKNLQGINYSQRERISENKADFKKPNISTNESHNNTYKQISGINKYETEIKSSAKLSNKDKSAKCDKLAKDNVHKADKKDRHDSKDRKTDSQKKTKFDSHKKQDSQLNIKVISSKPSESHHHIHKISKSPDKKVVKSDKPKHFEKRTIKGERSPKLHLDKKNTKISTARKSFSVKPTKEIKDLTLKKSPVLKSDFKKR